MLEKLAVLSDSIINLCVGNKPLENFSQVSQNLAFDIFGTIYKDELFANLENVSELWPTNFVHDLFSKVASGEEPLLVVC